MDYNEILQAARTCMGPYCKACPVCNGRACGNTVPGPGSNGLGVTFQRNLSEVAGDLCADGHHLRKSSRRYLL